MTRSLNQHGAYDLEPIDWTRASPVFREFFHQYFVDSRALIRGEVDLAPLTAMRAEEMELARALLRRNLRLRYSHIIDGVAHFGDLSAVPQLRALLEGEQDLSRRLTVARALWRLTSDSAFIALLSEMVASPNSILKQAHIDDVLLVKDERAIDLLIALLDDPDSFVRSLALSRLNGLEFHKHYLLSAADLPHDPSYYRAHCRDPRFVAQLVESLQAAQADWPVVWTP